MKLSTVRLHLAHAEDDIQGPQGLEAGVTPDQTSTVEPQTCMPAATTRPPQNDLPLASHMALFLTFVFDTTPGPLDPSPGIVLVW